MSAVDGMCDAINARKVRNGEPCRDGLCGRTEGVWSAWPPDKDATRGPCPTCETQEALWWRFWASMGAPNGPGK